MLHHPIFPQQSYPEYQWLKWLRVSIALLQMVVFFVYFEDYPRFPARMVDWEHVVGDPTIFLDPVYIVDCEAAEMVVGESDLEGVRICKSSLMLLFGEG
jgi:hypothetical protein